MDLRFACVTLFLHLLILLAVQKSGAARVLGNEKLSEISDGDHKNTNHLRLHTTDVGKENDRSSNAKLHDVKQHSVDNQLWIYDNQFWIYDKKNDGASDKQASSYARKDEAVDKQFWIHDKKDDAIDNQLWIYDKKDDAVDNQFWIYDKKNDAIDNQVWIYDKKDDAVDNQFWIYDNKNDAIDNQVWIYDKKDDAVDNQFWIYDKKNDGASDTKNDGVDDQFWIYDKKNDAIDNQVRIYDTKDDAADNQFWIYYKKNDGALDKQASIYSRKYEAVDKQVWTYDKKDDANDNQVWMYDKKNDNSQAMVGTGHASSHLDHTDPKLLGFFKLEDLKQGKTMFTKFPKTDPSSSLLLLPKAKADTIPFSLKQFPNILQFFPFSQESPQAKAMEDTLRKCEVKPIKGETKFCATSYESMLNFARGTFGLQTNVKVLSTVHRTRSNSSVQKYTIVNVPERISAPKMVACHTMPYPYKVFYCHHQESESRVYKISLNGENGDRVEAIAVCHMDTSHWSPDHISFRVLGVEPGTSPVCHFFAANHHVLVPSAQV